MLFGGSSRIVSASSALRTRKPVWREVLCLFYADFIFVLSHRPPSRVTWRHATNLESTLVNNRPCFFFYYYLFTHSHGSIMRLSLIWIMHLFFLFPSNQLCLCHLRISQTITAVVFTAKCDLTDHTARLTYWGDLNCLHLHPSIQAVAASGQNKKLNAIRFPTG